MNPADPQKPMNSVSGLLSDQDLRRYLINRGWLIPRIEGLPWTENFDRAKKIQRERRKIERTERAR